MEHFQKTSTDDDDDDDDGWMAGRWSLCWEEYGPCGIGLTSHSLPSASQDM